MAGRAPLIVFLLVSCVAMAHAQTSLLTLAELERRALAANPTIAQAAAQVTATEARMAQAGRWANPSIGYTAEEVSNSVTIRGGEHGFFVEQVFPISGKLGATQAIFARVADQAVAIREAQRLRVINTVRTLYYEALIAARRVAVRNDLAALSDEAVDVSRRLANVGAADRTDLLASEIEAEQARLAVDDARNAERRIWQHLVQVIGDPMLGPQPLAGDPDENLPTLNADLALATLLRESPELAAAEAGVERARAELVRSRKEQNPDLVVRAGPRYNRELLDPGPKPVGWEFFADVGVSVPLWNRNEAGIAAAEAELGRATAELTRVELVLRSRLAEVFEQYATATARVRAYREDIVPRAVESHRLFLGRYQDMAAAYPQVLVAQRTRFQVTEEYLEALATSWRAAVLIEGRLLDAGLATPEIAGEGLLGSLASTAF